MVKEIKENTIVKKVKFNIKVIEKYATFLKEEEKNKGTVEKYTRDILAFYEYLPENKEITKEELVAYKQSLTNNYKISSINSMLVAINGLLSFLGLADLKLKQYKIQKKSFYEEGKELTKEEYKRLLDAARRKNNHKLNLLIQTICATGIRVSEHQFITVESLKEGKAFVNNKGKTRAVFISKELAVLLQTHCRKEKIKEGPIFVTKNGKPMDRSNIWKAMKKLCEDANVDASKVFPHNLRHLFALTYYRLQKDVVRLADILGHSSVETTRIYTMTSYQECQKSMSKMNLVLRY